MSLLTITALFFCFSSASAFGLARPLQGQSIDNDPNQLAKSLFRWFGLIRPIHNHVDLVEAGKIDQNIIKRAKGKYKILFQILRSVFESLLCSDF